MVACFGIFAMCVVIEVVGFGRRLCCCDLSQFFIWMLIPDVLGVCHGEWFSSVFVLVSFGVVFGMSKIAVRLWFSVVDVGLACPQESCLSVARPRFVFVIARPWCLFHDVGWIC